MKKLTIINTYYGYALNDVLLVRPKLILEDALRTYNMLVL
jgi:hypothetical protein